MAKIEMSMELDLDKEQARRMKRDPAALVQTATIQGAKVAVKITGAREPVVAKAIEEDTQADEEANGKNDAGAAEGDNSSNTEG
ncbi:MAG: hypothetical protein WC455_17085 [Dehalococcoidia bacterium]|jgi:hypothetical protein